MRQKSDIQKKLERDERKKRAEEIEEFFTRTDLGKYLLKTWDVRKANLCLQGMTGKEVIDWGEYKEQRGRILEIDEIKNFIMDEIKWLRKIREQKTKWKKDI